MFDLNEQITKWRTSLAESEKCSKPDIDELETHLREEIEHLASAELSQQEAFVIAKGRLGDTPSLENEFAKVNGGYILRNRLFWMVVGVIAYLMAECLAGAFGNAGVYIVGQAGWGPYAAAAVSIISGALAYGLIFLLACLACRPGSRLFRFDRFTSNHRRKLVLFSSLLLLGIEYIRRMLIIPGYVPVILPIVLPVALLGVFIKLGISRYRTVRR